MVRAEGKESYPREAVKKWRARTVVTAPVSSQVVIVSVRCMLNVEHHFYVRVRVTGTLFTCEQLEKYRG